MLKIRFFFLKFFLLESVTWFFFSVWEYFYPIISLNSSSPFSPSLSTEIPIVCMSDFLNVFAVSYPVFWFYSIRSLSVLLDTSEFSHSSLIHTSAVSNLLNQSPKLLIWAILFHFYRFHFIFLYKFAENLTFLKNLFPLSKNDHFEDSHNWSIWKHCGSNSILQFLLFFNLIPVHQVICF